MGSPLFSLSFYWRRSSTPDEIVWVCKFPPARIRWQHAALLYLEQRHQSGRSWSFLLVDFVQVKPSPGGQFLFKPWILGVAQQGFLSSVDTWKFFIPGIYRSHSLQREFSFSLSSREMNAEALPASWEMVFLSLPSPTESQLLFHLAPCLCTQINSSDHQAEKTDSILVMVHICHYM